MGWEQAENVRVIPGEEHKRLRGMGVRNRVVGNGQRGGCRNKRDEDGTDVGRREGGRVILVS